MLRFEPFYGVIVHNLAIQTAYHNSWINEGLHHVLLRICNNDHLTLELSEPVHLEIQFVGISVESFIQKQPRTALSYFIKPLRDQITNAVREK